MKRRKQAKHWTQPDPTSPEFKDWFNRGKNPPMPDWMGDDLVKSAWKEHEFRLRKPQFLDPKFLKIMLKDKDFWFGPEESNDSEFYDATYRGWGDWQSDWYKEARSFAEDVAASFDTGKYVAGKGNTCHDRPGMVPVVEYTPNGKSLRVYYVYDVLKGHYYSTKAANCYTLIPAFKTPAWKKEAMTKGIQKFFSKKSSDYEDIKDWLKTKVPVEVEHTPIHVTYSDSRELVA